MNVPTQVELLHRATSSTHENHKCMWSSRVLSAGTRAGLFPREHLATSWCKGMRGADALWHWGRDWTLDRLPPPYWITWPQMPTVLRLRSPSPPACSQGCTEVWAALFVLRLKLNPFKLKATSWWLLFYILHFLLLRMETEKPPPDQSYP